MSETEVLERKGAKQRKPGLPLDDGTEVIQKQEPIVAAQDIISKVGAIPQGLTPEEEDALYNPIEEGMDTGTKGMPTFEPVELPAIRKVAIKKISRFEFRLGLEKTPEKSKMMPGCMQRWMCDKKGNEFMTGLDDYPQAGQWDRLSLLAKEKQALGCYVSGHPLHRWVG